MLAWAVGLVGGGTALFYGLGYTIVNTYIRRVGLEGMFWLPKQFYTDAGATFLLDMVRAPLLSPHLFFGYLLLLTLLVPRELVRFNPAAKAAGGTAGRISLSNLQWLRLAVVLLIIVLMFLLTSFYTVVREDPLFLSVMRAISIFDANQASLTSSKSGMEVFLAFFSFVTPLVLFFGNFFVQARSVLLEKSRRRLYYFAGFVVYVVFLAGIPVSYANHLYDWKLVPLKEPQVVHQILHKDAPDHSSLRIWLLGQSDDEYVFLTLAEAFGEGVIASVFGEGSIASAFGEGVIGTAFGNRAIATAGSKNTSETIVLFLRGSHHFGTDNRLSKNKRRNFFGIGGSLVGLVALKHPFCVLQVLLDLLFTDRIDLVIYNIKQRTERHGQQNAECKQ